LPILRSWCCHWRNSETRIPYQILTDRQTCERLANKEIQRVDLRDFDPSPFADLMRQGNPYDYKSALICAALPHLPANSIIMDSDALIMRDITHRFDVVDGEPFAMVPDSGRRRIPWSGPHGKTIMEHSSSVMFFGTDDPVVRACLVATYRMAWHWLAANDDAKGQIEAIREQRAWSLVHWWEDAILMAEDLNYSHTYKSHERAYVIHHHGAGKLTATPCRTPRSVQLRGLRTL
jgi:hypothetical protein